MTSSTARVSDYLPGPQDVPNQWIIDVQAELPQHADLEGDLLNLLHGLTPKEPPCRAG
jgi:hypothetical protein